VRIGTPIYAPLLFSLSLIGCSPSGTLPSSLWDNSADPVDASWCVGGEKPALVLCSFDGCADISDSYLLEVARRPQNSVTAMVGIRVDGLGSEDSIGNLSMRFTDDQGFELCGRERRHLSTLCREEGAYVLEFVELYFDPEPHPQSWDGIEGVLSAEIELGGTVLQAELPARLVATGVN